MRRIGVALVLVIALVPAAAAQTQPVVVEISGFAFNPQEVTVPLGATVRWINRDGAAHTATSGHFGSPLLGQGEQWEFTFPAPGRYPYICDVHPEMTGLVIVTGP